MKMKIRKKVNVLMWAMVLVIAGGMGLISMGCGCGENGDGGTPAEIVFVYPSPTNPPGENKPIGIPLEEATDVPLNIIIIGTSSDTDKLEINTDTFSMTVNDGTSDIDGQMEISFDFSSVIFIPKDYLKENTTYTITVSQTAPNYQATISFSTVSSPGTFKGQVGQGYALKIAPGSVTQPPGVGELVEGYLADINIVLAGTDVQDKGDGTGIIQITGGEGNTAQDTLTPGSFVLPLSGSFRGEYVRMVGILELDVEGFVLKIDNFNISGKVIDMAGGVGITEGTLAAIADCSKLDESIRGVVQSFCTLDTNLLILVGSFYATPFDVTPAEEALGSAGAVLTATITNPSDGATNVPVATTASVDIGRNPWGPACIAITSTSVSVTIRDWESGQLMLGTTAIKLSPTTVAPSPCGIGNGKQIIGATFTPSALESGHTYKMLNILDLTVGDGISFTTQ